MQQNNYKTVTSPKQQQSRGNTSGSTGGKGTTTASITQPQQSNDIMDEDDAERQRGVTITNWRVFSALDAGVRSKFISKIALIFKRQR